MKKLLFHIFLLLWLSLSGSIEAQDLEKELISWIENHSKEELKYRLDTVSYTHLRAHET